MQGIRYTDNSDYLSPMLCEIAYVGAAEQLMGLEPPRRAQHIRLLVGEMQRIASYLVAVGTYLLDLGAFTPVLWTFRDREGILREVPVQIQVRQEGDCYARNAVRMQEMRESIRLCRIAIDPGPFLWSIRRQE